MFYKKKEKKNKKNQEIISNKRIQSNCSWKDALRMLYYFKY